MNITIHVEDRLNNYNNHAFSFYQIHMGREKYSLRINTFLRDIGPPDSGAMDLERGLGGH